MGKMFYILFGSFFIIALSMLIWSNRDKPKVNEKTIEKESNERIVHNSPPFYFSSSSVSSHLIALKVASLNLGLGNHGAVNQVINDVMLEKLHFQHYVNREGNNVLIYSKSGKKKNFIVLAADPSNLEATAIMLNLAEWIDTRNTETDFIFMFGWTELKFPAISLVIHIGPVNSGPIIAEFSSANTQKIAKRLALRDNCNLDVRLVGENPINCIWLRSKDKSEVNLDDLAKLTAFISYMLKLYGDCN